MERVSIRFWVAACFVAAIFFAVTPSAEAGEPWPPCGDPPDPCCQSPCSSSCDSITAKCDANCPGVDPDCCDDPCGAACMSTAAKCENACPDVDPDCCDDPCGSACSSTAAKCEADCPDVDPACCDDPCGAACMSTAAKCEAGCSDVDPACCDDPCGAACESTSAKCEAGCEGLDPDCCDDPCGAACSSASAKCEAECGDVNPACCEDPCGGACDDLDAKCEAGCENVPERCCEDGAASEEDCECPEPACSSTLSGEVVCTGEEFALPVTITNTVDPKEECLTTFDWEVYPVSSEGPVLDPQSGSVMLAAGESVEVEALFETLPGSPEGLVDLQLDVSNEGDLLCTSSATADVRAPDAVATIAMPSQLDCPAFPDAYRVSYGLDIENTGICAREFTWTFEQVAGNVVLLDLPDTGTTGMLEPGAYYLTEFENFRVSEASPSGTATLQVTVEIDGQVVDVKTETFTYERLEVAGAAGNVVACVGQVAQMPRALLNQSQCNANFEWTATEGAGTALVDILTPVTEFSLGGGQTFSTPLPIAIEAGSTAGSTRVIHHQVVSEDDNIAGDVVWSGSSVVTAQLPDCSALLDDAAICAGDATGLMRQITNTGQCSSTYTWNVTQTGGSVPATITAGGTGTTAVLQPGASQAGSVAVSTPSGAGSGTSNLLLSVYDPSGSLVCQDPGVLIVSGLDNWGPWVGTGIGMPDLFLNTVNNLVSAIPGVGVEIQEASISLQERTRDCCTAGNFVPDGEVEGQGTLNFEIIGDGPIPVLPVPSFDFEVDVGVAILEVDFDIGLFWGFDVSLSGTAGKRFNVCQNIDCFYGGIGASATLQLTVEFDAIACFESWWTTRQCAGFTIIPAGISAAFTADLGWNLDSCTSGLDANAAIGQVQVFAQFEVWYFGKMNFRRTVWDGIPLF